MKKAVLIMTCLLYLGILSTVIFVPGSVAGETLYVGGTGLGNYTSIQGAIDDASPMDTIFVYNGTYHEHLKVNKTVSLVGEDRNATVIDGNGIGDVVRVTADWVNITNFTVANSGLDLADAGIELSFVRNCSITDNSLSNNGDGIILYFSDDNNVVGNTIELNNGNGIFLWYSSSNTLTDNIMTQNGIYVFGHLPENWNTHFIDTSNTVNGKPVRYWKDVVGGIVPSDAGQVILANCTDVVVENQNVSDSSVGIELGFSSNSIITNNTVSFSNFEGIHVSYSSNNTIIENTFLWNRGTGVRFSYSSNNTIIGNNASWNNGYGIGLYYSSYNEIIMNNLLWNSYFGVLLDFSQSNWIYHNNFIDNAEQASDNKDTSQWDNGYPSGGNYWSEYIGSDQFSGPDQDQLGSDGIGDTPYSVDEDTQDRYPLVSFVRITHPRPPKTLQAMLSGKESENVTLVWSLSPDDGMGLKSVVGYEIYRNMTYNPKGLGYGLVASLPNGTSTFIDSYMGEGDPNNYFYRVCAMDLSNNITCTMNQGGKFTRHLSEGPNLISVPLIQSNESIETVLQTVEYDKAWLYDSSSQEWKWYMKSKAYRRGLWSINHTIGSWVNMTSDCNLTVAGIVPPQTMIHLHKGWNLMAFPSFNTMFTVADLKATVPLDKVESFQTVPPHFLRVLSDSDVLLAGQGYWMRVETDTVWTIEII